MPKNTEKPRAKTPKRTVRTSKKQKDKSRARIFKYTGLDGIKYELTIQEKKFCDCYLTFKANGVDAIYEAGYNPKNALIAASLASRMLTKVNIFTYINLKLEEFGFSDDSVDKQHLFLLNQHTDLKTKAKAIDMFYKLRGRYAPDKGEVKVVEEFSNYSTAVLKKAFETGKDPADIDDDE